MGKLIIDLLSDTHNQHEKFKMEGGDIVLHSGDCSLGGKHHEINHFLDWYGELDYSHRILIPGNHDWAFERQSTLMKEECQKRGIILLNDSSVILKDMAGTYQFVVHGSPIQPWFHSWAFNRYRGEDIKRHWDMIPEDTEILLTHGPPAGILDIVNYVDGTPKERVGCQDLADKLSKLKVKLHVFGHIHESRGILHEKDTLYINGSSLDRMYTPWGLKPIRIVRETLQDGSILYTAEE